MKLYVYVCVLTLSLVTFRLTILDSIRLGKTLRNCPSSVSLVDLNVNVGTCASRAFLKENDCFDEYFLGLSEQ